MDIELHQLDLRYQDLRKRHPQRERQLLASLAEVGQQLPIVGVMAQGRFVVIDGYKRVRALKRLARDTVRATPWDIEEAEALLLERLMRRAGEDALEQAWLLVEMHQRFGLSCDELARRFDRSKSWISRRLALVRELPATIQEQVRSGAIAAHAAMKYLVPLARGNAVVAEQLAAAVAPLKLSTRQVGQLYSGWQEGTQRTRELILTHPEVYLRAQQDVQRVSLQSPIGLLVAELGSLAGIARRARKRVEPGFFAGLTAAERGELDGAIEQTRRDTDRLFQRFTQEVADAR